MQKHHSKSHGGATGNWHFLNISCDNIICTIDDHHSLNTSSGSINLCYCQLLVSHLLQLILTSDLPSFLSQLQTSLPHAMLDYWSQLHHWTPQMRVVVMLSVHCWKLVHSCHAHDETWDHCNRTQVQILQESAQGAMRLHFHITST